MNDNDSRQHNHILLSRQKDPVIKPEFSSRFKPNLTNTFLGKNKRESTVHFFSGKKNYVLGEFSLLSFTFLAGFLYQ